MEPLQHKALGSAPVERLSYVAEHDFEEAADDFEAHVHPFAWLLSTACFPIGIFSCFTLTERTHAVVLHFGRVSEVSREPGIHCSPICGRDIRRISVAKHTIELPKLKIVDLNGNPLLVSAIITQYVSNARRAALNVTDLLGFVRGQAESVLRQVVARFPYESEHGGPSLKTEANVIGRELVELLQHKVDVAGVKIVSFDVNELSYAPEIATAMLRKQQAGALLAARKVIVDGAVQISVATAQDLAKSNVILSDADKSHLIINLLTVIASDKEVSPVLQV